MGKLIVHGEKEVGSLFNTMYKNYLKRDQRPTIKVLEENKKGKLHNIGFGNDFLNMTPEAQATKEIDKLLMKKFKHFRHQKTLCKE